MTRERLLGAAFFLVFAVGIAAAQNGWRSKQEYRFHIEGRSMANLPGIPRVSETSTGIHFRGSLRVQNIGSNVLIMKLLNMTYTRVHTELPGGWWGQIPQAAENFRDMPITDSTFSVKMNGGTVENLVVTTELEDWESNFIQGVVSQLQVDLLGKNAIHSTSSNSMHGHGDYQEAPVYTVMEDSVAGRCEVRYDVAPLPKSIVTALPHWLPRADLCGSRDYLEITKTRNFDNCEKLAEYHYGLPSSLRCQPGGNQCGEFWTRASVTRITGCGNRKDFLILSAISSSRVIASLHLHNGSEAAVSSYLNISLASVKPVSRRFNLPTNPTKSLQSLVYQYTPTFTQAAEGSSSPRTGAESEESTERANKSDNDKNGSEDIVVYKRNKNIKIRNRRRVRSRSTTSTTTSTTTTTSTEFPPMVPENSIKEMGLWSLPQPDTIHPPHRPFSAFSLAHVQGDAHSCMMQQLKDLITDIAIDMEAPKFIVEKMTLEKVNLAVDICRTMMLVDLQKSVTHFMDTQIHENNIHLTERKIVRDVMIMCGTNPAFQIIKSWVEQKKVKGESAAQMLSELPNNLQTPDAGIIQQFYELTRSSAVKDDQQVQISAVLAFSNLLRVACVNDAARRARYPVQVLGVICTPETAAQYLPWLSDQLRGNSALRKVYVAALGNTGALGALRPLQTVAEDSTASPYLRASAILAMRHHALQDPDAVYSILNAFYHNMGQPLAVRMASLSLLLFTKPDLTTWQRIAVATWYEPNPALVSFVWSSLTSMSKARDPMYKKMSQMATAVVHLAKPATQNLYLPHNVMYTSVREELNQVIMDHLSWSGGVDASHVYYRHTRRQGGFSRVLSQAELWVANPDDFWTLLRELIHSPAEDVAKVRPAMSNLPRSTSRIREQLKIAARNLPKVEGDLHLTLDSLSERLLTFDKKIINDFVKSGRKLVDQMKSNKDFHYQKLGQQVLEMATTTDLGFPVTFHLKTLWAFRTTGNMQLTQNNLGIGLEASMLYTSQLMSELSVFPVFDGVEHLAASYGTSLVQLPSLRLNLHLDKPVGQLQLIAQMRPPNIQFTFINHNSTPFTAQRDILNVTPVSLGKGTRFVPLPTREQTETLTLSNLNISYASSGQPKRMFDWVKNGAPVHAFPMMWPSLEPAFFTMGLNDLAPISANFSIGEAEARDGAVNIKQWHGLAETHSEQHHDNSTNTEMNPESIEREANDSSDAEANSSSDSDERGDESTTSTSTTETVTTELTTAINTEEPTTEAEEQSSEETSMRSTTEVSTTEMEQELEQSLDDGEDISIQSIDMSSNNPSHSFNATTLDPFKDVVNGSNKNYVLTQILSGINSGSAVLLSMNASVLSKEPSNYRACMVYGEGLTGRIQRGGIFLKASESQWEFGLTGSIVTPPVPLLDLGHILRSNMSSQISAEIMSLTNGTVAMLSMKGSMSRGYKTTQALLASQQTQRCLTGGAGMSIKPMCREIAQKASYMDRYTSYITFNEEVKNYFGLGSHAESNVARAALEMDGDNNMANLWFQIFNSDSEYPNIQLLPPVAYAIRQTPGYSMSEQSYGPGYCGVDGAHVVTYDGLEFDYRMGDCWHVLSKDCSGKSRVVVLARTNNNYTEVEVNVDNYKVVSLKPGLDILVNNKPMTLAENQIAEAVDQGGTVLMQISSSADRAIKLSLPAHDVMLVYANSSVVITTSSSMRGRLCGLCGDNNGEILNELKNPRGVTEKDVRDFASSYALSVKGCRTSLSP